MIHHYITKYEEDGEEKIVAWLQINFFGFFPICFSKRELRQKNHATPSRK